MLLQWIHSQLRGGIYVLLYVCTHFLTTVILVGFDCIEVDLLLKFKKGWNHEQRRLPWSVTMIGMNRGISCIF